MSSVSPSSRAARRALARPVLFVLLVVGILLLGQHTDLGQLLDPARLRALGARPSPGLMLAWAALWVSMMGGSMPAIAAGAALFGWVGGSVASVIGAMAAHSAWFLLTRGSLRPLVWSRAGPRVRWLITLVDRGGVGLVGAWSLLGGPGGPLLFAAALSRLPYRSFALGLLAMTPRVVITSLLVDTLLTWPPDQVPPQRWLLIAGIGLPLVLVYAALLWLRPALRPWRFGDPDLHLPPEPLSLEPLSLEPLSLEPLSPEPLSPEPLSPEPLSPEPLSPEQDAETGVP